MAPDAPAAERERVFAAWTAALGLRSRMTSRRWSSRRLVDGGAHAGAAHRVAGAAGLHQEIAAGLAVPSAGGGLPPLTGRARGAAHTRPGRCAPASRVWSRRPRRPSGRARRSRRRRDDPGRRGLPAGLRLTLHPHWPASRRARCRHRRRGRTAQLSAAASAPASSQPTGVHVALPRAHCRRYRTAANGRGARRRGPETVLLATRDLLHLLGRRHLSPATRTTRCPSGCCRAATPAGRWSSRPTGTRSGGPVIVSRSIYPAVAGRPPTQPTTSTPTRKRPRFPSTFETAARPSRPAMATLAAAWRRPSSSGCTRRP